MRFLSHARERGASCDGPGVSLAWIVLGRWGCWSGQRSLRTNEQTLSSGLCGGSVSANERTNVGVGALFVRSHRSQGMGTGLHRPVCSFAMFAAKRGSGERTFVRSFVGARDVPKSWWSGRWVEGRRGGWACCKCVTTPHKLCYPLTSTSGGFISRLESRSGELFEESPETNRESCLPTCDSLQILLHASVPQSDTRRSHLLWKHQCNRNCQIRRF